MVIVQGVFRLDPSDVAAFLESRKPGMERYRAEQGNIEYAFGADPLEADRVVLTERWASRADFEAHAAAGRANPQPSAGPKPLSYEMNFFEATPFTM